MDLRGVFNSEPKSLFDTVSEAGLCFYLPAYQRPYTWDKKNIGRIFEDAIHGLANTIRNEDAITFIGTILTIHDTKFETIVPHKKGEVPSKVVLVIDGQQRLTSMLLIMTLLHDYLKGYENKIGNRCAKLKKLSADEAQTNELNDVEWLLDKINQEVANLRYFSTDTNSSRDRIYRWYPKLIRAYKDCWSKTENGAQYDSPIARYLHLYNQHILAADESGKYISFTYDCDNDDPDFETHEIIIKNIRSIKKHLRDISKSSVADNGYPIISELMGGTFGNAFQFDIPEGLIPKEGESDVFSEAINLIVFSKYFLQRVCLTYVTVTDEAYAFDMFEALNTTGEPLTSIETFKPKVIEEEGLGSYEGSESKKYFDVIDGFLDSISNAEEKHKATTRIMLSFALSETGEKISKHISDQRRYLLKSYRDEDANTKRGFVKNLSNVTRFYYEEWDCPEPNIINKPSTEENSMLLCLDVLRKSGHEITVPIISRFYSEIINSSPRGVTKDELEKALKSMLAFFVLWRGAHKNTAGIDSVYRDYLKSGNKDLGIDGFSRRNMAIPASSSLSLFLSEKLREKLGADEKDFREKWINAASKIPVYDISKPLTRIMMLASFHDTCPDFENPGMVENGTNGSSPMLTWYRWKLFDEQDAEKKFTLEHIAPQTITDDWDQTFYEDRDLLGTIGNLTILPSSANSSASNKSWVQKRKYYQALCQESKRKKMKVLKELNPSQQLILEQSQYLGYLEAISKVERWTASLVNERSKNMLGHVWDNFEPWLRIS